MTVFVQGYFTSEGIEKEIYLPGGCDYFHTRNITQQGLTQTPGRAFISEWFNVPAITPGNNLRIFKNDAVNTLKGDKDATGGFIYRTEVQNQESPVTGTAITAANPAVVSLTNTYSNGDVVALYGTTGMRQIAGVEFTISSVSGAAFTLAGLDASGFATAATAVIARRIPKEKPVRPFINFITKISQATQAVFTVSKIHDYSVGQLLHFTIPPSFGMQEMNEKTARVVSVTDYTFTVDLDSSSFSAFAFPADVLIPSVRLYATVAPAGQRNEYNVTTVPFQSGDRVPTMVLLPGVQSPAGQTGDVIVWQSWKQEN